MDFEPKDFYPGRRVRVLIVLPAKLGAVWFRGTVTKSRETGHEGKVRVWLDQKPTGWTTHEVIFSESMLWLSLVQPINQPDRDITPAWELATLFYHSAPVEVLVGLEWKQGVVFQPPTESSLNIVVRLNGGAEKIVPYHPAVIERIFRKPEISGLFL